MLYYAYLEYLVFNYIKMLLALPCELSPITMNMMRSTGKTFKELYFKLLN